MMNDLRDLYQEIILDHGKHPRNLRLLPCANRKAYGHNPMCGDTLTVFLRVNEAGIVREATFIGQGCAISLASASIMTEMLTEKSEIKARALFHVFHSICTSENKSEEDGISPLDILHKQNQYSDLLPRVSQDELERLQILSGVSQFPVRVKCATLAWHTMVAAIDCIGIISSE